MDISILKKIGFSEKIATVYIALLSRGPSSVRQIAEDVQLNRGTTYDALKMLQEKGAVTFFNKSSKQHFVAEDPQVLLNVITRKQEDLKRTCDEVKQVLPELQALYHGGESRPVAKYFEKKDLRLILEDILHTCEHADQKMYRTYSVEGVQKYLYKDFPTFSDARIAKGIYVQVISLGDGGEIRGLDERKWFRKDLVQDITHDMSEQGLQHPVPTYIMMYPGKTAYISLDQNEEPMGVVIENDGVSIMQQLIFDQLWHVL